MIIFLERLELYLSSGLSINKAIEIMAEGVSKKRLVTTLLLLEHIESGNTLSGSLANTIHLPPAILGLIRNGESVGKLPKALSFSRDLIEREDELIKKCFSAMTYPVVIGFFAFILTIGLMKGVMPQIMPMLKSLNVELPLLTRLVMFVSDCISSYGLLVLVGGIILCSIYMYSYSKIIKVRFISHAILLRIPIIGKIMHLYTVSLFMRSMGSLVESGLPAVSAYESTASAISILPIRKAFESESDKIKNGVSISFAITKINRVPSFVPSLVKAGEMTGSLGASLSRCSLIIDKDIEYALKKSTVLIEPVMMVGMGTVIGGIALSIIMPIYDVSKVLQH